MKKNIVLFCLLIIFNSLSAQVININPDPTGEPWLVGGYKHMTQTEIDKIPVIDNSSVNNSKDLPASWDNSKNKFFRPVFNQTDGCCAQASGIAYNYTYEYNLFHNTAANVTANQFPTHFTYNFLNSGSGEIGSNYTSGWEIVKNLGCPNVVNYGGLAASANYWLSEYDKYKHLLNNRIQSYFAINVSTPEGLNTLKHWIYDHLDGSLYGGLVNFSAGVTEGFWMTENNIITHFGNPVNHAMTIIGWDDNIKYDYNGDNQYTNDKDINGDQKIDMLDWEKGALIMVNSWGTFWGQSGKAYIMYKLLAETVENGGIANSKVYSIYIKKQYAPVITMNVKLQHSSRNKISIYAGVSKNLNASEPEFTMNFPIINYQGGDFPMCGYDNYEPIEVTLDITQLLNYFDSGQKAKIFFGTNEKDADNFYEGYITDMSVETASQNFQATSQNVPIENNKTTWVSCEVTMDFETPLITNNLLNNAAVGQYYSQQITASGGEAPYSFNILIDYTETENNNTLNISNQTKITPTNDDDGYVTQKLDFEFPFYGKKYSEIHISTDGAIVFTPEFSFIRDQISIRASKVISVFAADLMIYPELQQGIFYAKEDNAAIFTWKCGMFEQPEIKIDVSIKIHTSGEIEFFYGDQITQDLIWTSGISNGDGINFLFPNNAGIENPQNTKTKMTTKDFPYGLTLTNEGMLEGTIHEADKQYDITLLVTDNRNIIKAKTLTLTTTTTSLPDFNDRYQIFCFPNPFVNEINVSIITKFDNEEVNIYIYDFAGKKVFEKNNFSITSGENIFKLSNLLLDKGIYFLKIESKTGTAVHKLFKI